MIDGCNPHWAIQRYNLLLYKILLESVQPFRRDIGCGILFSNQNKTEGCLLLEIRLG